MDEKNKIYPGKCIEREWGTYRQANEAALQVTICRMFFKALHICLKRAVRASCMRFVQVSYTDRGT